jgi:tripartite-type tricarboxylate transporter receptor subunit TctC
MTVLFNRLSRRGALIAAAAIVTSIAVLPVADPRSALAADYPTRNINIIVPFAAGGGSDIVARIMASYLSEALKVSVIVENRGGAGGNLGTMAAARAAPDGYTLMVVSSAFVVNPSLYDKPAYDALKDFIPLANVGAAPDVFTVPANSKYKTFKDFLDDAKANPGKINWASPGAGTTPYIVVEAIAYKQGLKMVHVPFGGAGPAMQAALSGQLDMYSANIGSVLGQIQAGSLRPLVQTGDEKWPDLPDVPRLADIGIKDITSENHQSIYLPAGTPPAIVDRLDKEIHAILARPEVQERIYKTGLKVVNEGPVAFKKRIDAEVAMYRELIDKAGITKIK